MGPHGSENFKTLFLIQMAAESFQTFEFMIVNECFFENFKFTIVPYGLTKNLNYLGNERL